MAVKVVCSICDEFIKNAEDMRSLTGREVCGRCGKRIDETFQHLDKSIKDFDIEIKSMYDKAKKLYGLITRLNIASYVYLVQLLL